jgi:hypothetical protein
MAILNIPSLGMNTTLKRSFCQRDSTSSGMSYAAIRNGLAKNSTLEKLSSDNMLPSDDDGALRHAMHFLFFAPTPLSSL